MTQKNSLLGLKPAFKKRLLQTTIITASVFCLMGEAQAVCNASAGSLIMPDNGSTVTCSGVTNQATGIGDGSTTASVILQDNAIFLITGGTVNAVNLNTITLLDMGNDTQLIGTDSAAFAVNNITATTGSNALIRGTSSGVNSALGDVALSLGAGSTIEGTNQYGVTAANGVTIIGGSDDVTLNGFTAAVYASTGDANITLGANADIDSVNGQGIFANQNITASFGANLDLDSLTSGIQASNGFASITLGNGSDIASVNNSAILAGGDLTILGGADDATLRGNANPTLFGFGAASNVDVTFGDRARILSDASFAINAGNDVTAVFGADADIDSVLTAINATNGNAHITLGNNANIDSQNGNAISANDELTILGGANNVTLTAGNVTLRALSDDINITLGRDVTITSATDSAINASSDVIASFGSNLDIDSVGHSIRATLDSVDLTLADTVNINSSGSSAVSAGGGDVIIRGGANDAEFYGMSAAIISDSAGLDLTLGNNAVIRSSSAQALNASTDITAVFGSGLDLDGDTGGILSSTASVNLTLGDQANMQTVTGMLVRGIGNLTVSGGSNNSTFQSAATVFSSGGTTNITLGDDVSVTSTNDGVALAQTALTAIIGDNADLDASNIVFHSLAGTASVTLGNNADLDSSSSSIISSSGQASLIGGANNVNLQSSGIAVQSISGSVDINLGNDAVINSLTNTAIEGNNNVVATFGTNADLDASSNVIRAVTGGINLTLGNTANLTSTGGNILSASQDVIISGSANDVSFNGPGSIVSSVLGGANLSFGDDATLNSSGANLVSTSGDITAFFGVNADLDTPASAFSSITGAVDVTLGAGSNIQSSAANIINAGTTATIDGGADNITLSANGAIANATGGDVNVTLGNNASLLSAGSSVFITTNDASVNLGQNANLLSSGLTINAASGAVSLTAGDGSRFESTASIAVLADGNVDIIGGADDITIVAAGPTISSSNGDVTATFGDNAQITSTGSTGIQASNMDIVFGQNATVQSASVAFSALGNADLTFGAGSTVSITGASPAISAGSVTADLTSTEMSSDNIVINGANDVTIRTGSSLTSNSNIGITGTAGGDTIDNAGLISGATLSLSLSGGDDVLTLRTGSNLTGNANGGVDNDTINLLESGSEDVNFTGFEILNMNGANWSLSGSSDITNVNVNSGVLANNGSIFGDVTLAGGQYGGTGTTNGALNNTTGVVAPGNSIGTQNINGNYVQGAGATLAIEVNGTASDVLAATGTATLDGTVQFSLFGSDPIADGTSYTFLTAGGGVINSFAAVDNQVPLINASLSYNANDVVVTFDRDSAAAAIAQNEGEAAVLDGLSQTIVNNPAGIAATETALNALSAAQISDAAASLSGGVNSTAIQSGMAAMRGASQAARGRLGDVTSRNYQTASLGDWVRAPEQGTAWLSATGGLGQTQSDGAARGTDYHYYGTSFGFDKALDSGAKWGLFGAYARTDSDMDGLSDEARADIYQAGVYAGSHFYNWAVSTTTSLAWLDFETRRPNQSGVGSAYADFEGYGLQTDIQALGAPLYANSYFGLSPFVGADFSVIQHEGYVESGGGALNLDVDSQTTAQFSTILGVQAAQTYHSERYSFSPMLRLGWSHEFLEDGSDFEASFAGVTSSNFDVDGPDRGRDALVMHASLPILSRADNAFTFYADYDGRLSNEATDHALSAGLRINW